MTQHRYPLLESLGVAVHETPVWHVKWAELRTALESRNLLTDYRRLASPAQTAYIDGPYPSDVERVLGRLFGA